MTFLTILITLVIERLTSRHHPRRHHAWFGAYCRWLARHETLQPWLARPWGAALALLPLTGGLLWLQWLSDAAGFLLAFPFALVVLLASLGPRDLGEDTEAYLGARDAGDDERAHDTAQSLCLSEVPDTEPRRSFAVAGAVVVLANRRLIGPLFWFVVLGPVGAAGYRLAYLMHEYLQATESAVDLMRGSRRLCAWVDWLPARVTAAGYAIAGNFDAVAHAWRSFAHHPAGHALSEADALLTHTGLGALDTFPDDADDLAGDAGIPPDVGLIPPVVEDAMALVWRMTAVWVAVIGGGSLIAAVA